MTALRQMALWPQLRSAPFALLIATLSFCLVRARNQPSIKVGVGGTTASIVPADLLLAALAIVALATVLRRGLAPAARPAAIAAAAFCLLLIATAAANGSTAFVSGGKVVEVAALALGVVVLAGTLQQLEAIVDLLLLFTIAADAVGIVKFAIQGGGRQASFLGEHDFAALATLPLLYGLALLHAGERPRRAWTAIVAGSIGCILGSALASLLGLYLGTLALLVLFALWRRLTLRTLAATAAVLTVVTAGTLGLRAGELGFIQSWFGSPATRPGEYAGSWSQRLIYAYVGGRIFLAHPVLGTGWYGDVPPQEFAAYLPDARRRFSDQPTRYFPAADKPFIPQQTYDEVLYELGAVGAALLLSLLVALGAAARRATRLGAGPAAALPAAWLAASIGALAGEGLFGGSPLAATFWLVAGVVVAISLRVPQG